MKPLVDFDFHVPTTREDSDAAWRSVREECPAAWTDTAAVGSHWVLSGYEAVWEAFRDWEHLSSARTDPERCAIALGDAKMPQLIPEETDPPEWYGYRRILAVLLAPQPVEKVRPRVRYWSNHYIDQFIEAGSCELTSDLAVAVPAAVSLEWLGFAPADWSMIAFAFHDIAAYPIGSPEFHTAMAALGTVMECVREEVVARRREPRDDALTAIACAEIDGERVSQEIAESLAFQTVGGGVDTTTSLIGAALLHLSRFPDDRARLLEDPDLIGLATEEFLRFYPPARTHARTVVKDVEIAGCPIRAGDRVLLSEASAGRDEAAFPDADRFVIDRSPNRHLSFGVGIHRCVGSNLARLEFGEVMRAVLQRIPDYTIDEARVVEYPSWGVIGGWSQMPAVFTPGSRLSAPARS